MAVVAELSVLVLAIGAAAVLTSVPTGRESASASIPSGPEAATVDGLFVTFETVPAGADTSRLLIKARSIIKPAPGPIEAVSVRLVGPDGRPTAVDLAEVEAGRFEVDVARLAPGDWHVDVAVHRTAVDDAVAQVVWSVRSPAPDRPGPFELASTWLALAMLLGLALVVGLARARRHGFGRSWMGPIRGQAGPH